MDAASITLILGVVAEGVGVAAEISALARRVLAGETITDAELDAAKAAARASCQAWDEYADKDD